MSTEKYYLNDLESGISYEVSKEQKERYEDAIRSVYPKTKDKSVGKIIITGTGSELSKNNFNNLFFGKHKTNK